MSSSFTARWARWRRPILSFAVGQPAVQVLNLLTGFFLLRWLSVADYAQFGVAFAFQSTISQLADLGFSSSIMALAGERSREPEVMGRYLKAAMYFRNRLMFGILIASAVLFPWMTANQPWGWEVKLSLFIAIACGVLAQSWMIYMAPLLAHRELRHYYQPQILCAAGRLVASYLAHVSGILSAALCTWIGVAALAGNGALYRRNARPFFTPAPAADAEVRREMFRYLAPLIPGVIFTAAQSQITVAIITIFGSTQNVAEVSALGRLGQLFLILGAFNSVLVAPHISALAAPQLLRRYIEIFGAAVVLAIGIAGLGFLFPDALLWFLGSKYANLRDQIGWVVLTGCVSYLSGVLWTMNAGRRWIYWWGTGVYIGALIVAQIGCAMFLNLSQTSGVIFFGLVTAITVLFVHVATGLYGLSRPRANQ